MKYHTCYATITGKVFVPQEELHQRILEKFPELADAALATPAQEREAFEDLARGKIDALLPTDEPMKHCETTLDMDTYSHS